MDLNVWEHVKDAVAGLCPIIGSVNWRRRATDDKNGSNPFMQFILRTGVSLVVAAVLSIGGGILSAEIVLSRMEVQLANLAAQEIQDRTLLYNRQDRLEDRINNLSTLQR